MIDIADYSNPFDAIHHFEQELARFTGAPYVVTTDCCSHAIEIAFRLAHDNSMVRLPAYTYLSVPMTLHKLSVPYELIDLEWTDQYHFQNSRVWDSARYLELDMFQSGQIHCLSFGRTKPLSIGRGGCLLTDNIDLYRAASRMRSDGRDLFGYTSWSQQGTFEIGFHYWMRPEDCVRGLNMLHEQQFTPQTPDLFRYPDCRQLDIKPYARITI